MLTIAPAKVVNALQSRKDLSENVDARCVRNARPSDQAGTTDRCVDFLEGVAPVDITPVQYAALVAIGDNPGIDATRFQHLSPLIARH